MHLFLFGFSSKNLLCLSICFFFLVSFSKSIIISPLKSYIFLLFLDICCCKWGPFLLYFIAGFYMCMWEEKAFKFGIKLTGDFSKHILVFQFH